MNSTPGVALSGLCIAAIVAAGLCRSRNDVG
jgi:hypothetical protein